MSAVDPKSFNTPEVQFIRPDEIDNVARALITLTREVAVLSDRVLVLEEVLERQGVSVREAIDTYQPSEEFQQRTNDAMGEILRNVLASLRGADGS
jgi:hypothetical protein